MSQQPLVSVICLCYNHSNYVIEALNSVTSQDYKAIEVIIVDDFSTDKSAILIVDWVKNNNATYIKNEKNLGNTTSFNKALKLAKGDYVIDFATDDVLLPNSISERVKLFYNSDYDNLGVVFSNVAYIDDTNKLLNYQYAIDNHGKAKHTPKTGFIYKELVAEYLISASSMLIKKSVLDQLHGYDESLSYEDLDFWFRSSRYFAYDYVDQVLIKKRITKNSLGKQFYLFGKNSMSNSTYKVCKKALRLNKSKDEDKALLNRIKYEIKLSLKNMDLTALFKFISLWIRVKLSVFRKK
ncbi:glycosyltransferase [Ichthyenterobacterium sp. W332]|uniref:Glycosyltransferase n=1 Tax=Microcosmobacter mediterraneus TaxID=3075607 RepID=A0ABU2YMH6_9FLAO|nr:glycosyltransferase [Ichthyenterobacterium sp. W332]MDT0559242.1 glycosyltransferase [Ichthyenterobacterium sp. W332]